MKIFVLFFVPIILLLNISACRSHNKAVTNNKAVTKKGNNPFFYPRPSYEIYDNAVFREKFYPPIKIPSGGDIITEKSILHEKYIFVKKTFLNNNSSGNASALIDKFLKIYFSENNAPNIKELISEYKESYKHQSANYSFLICYAGLLNLDGQQKNLKKLYSKIKKIQADKNIPPLQKFFRICISGETKKSKLLKKSIDRLVDFLANNKLQQNEYKLILSFIRKMNKQKEAWNYLFAKIKNNKTIVPEWFYKTISGNYEINRMNTARVKALKARWRNDFKLEQAYWEKYNQYNSSAKILFTRACFLNPNCPEAAFGQLKTNRIYSADINDSRNNVTACFNMAVQAQVDFIPAYIYLMYSFRSMDWGETRIMKCAEASLNSGLFETRVPDMYLYGLISAASDFRFAWEATFQYERVFTKLNYYFENKLKNAKTISGKKLILARALQMYRLCKKYDKVAAILEKIPPKYNIANAFKGLYYKSRLAVLKRNRKEVIAELQAYSGINKRLLHKADEAIKSGLGNLEEKILRTALEREKNIEAKSYIITRLAMKLAARDTEYIVTPQNLLGYCARKFKFDSVNFLRKNNCNFNNKMTYGRFPLGYFLLKKYKVSQNGKILAMLKLLLDSGANTNSKDKYGNSPLHYAAANNINPEVSKILVANNADINAVNFNKSTPLLLACKKNNIKVAKYLASLKNININHIGKKKYTALMYAVLRSKPELVETLLKYGAKTDTKLKYGWTPLGIAVYNNKYKTAAALIRAGANPDKGADGTTPLIIAVVKNRIKCIKLLLDAGADPYKEDKSGKNMFAYIKPNQKEIKALLRSWNAPHTRQRSVPIRGLTIKRI